MTAAREICERHSTLSDFLKTVANVDEKTAKEDAGWIGHYLSQSTYAGIKEVLNSVFSFRRKLNPEKPVFTGMTRTVSLM
ncbi:MAG: hypothetical protein J5910_01755 [Lachnospiraceae bacterium]|nr:hypothetical protein [Lachnospiraceae bacterium]